MALKKIKLGELIEPCDERNSENKYTLQYGYKRLFEYLKIENVNKVRKT